MDYDSPDVAKDFPGLYASESMKRSQSHGSDYSEGEVRKEKDKKKDKKDLKKDKGYQPFDGESSDAEVGESGNSGKIKKHKLSSFKFRGTDKKEKGQKSKDRSYKESKEEKEEGCKKEENVKSVKYGKDVKDVKVAKKKKRRLSIMKDKKEKHITQEIKDEKPIFGVSLHDAVERSKSHDDIELPVIVRECIDYIEEHGLSCEGIYRISGLKSKLRQLKNQYNRSEKVYLYEHEPHVVANLLKVFLHDLPDPILTAGWAPFFEEASTIKNPIKRLEMLQELVNRLPKCNQILLSWIIVHMLHVVALEKRNKMNLQNISIILSPTLRMNISVLHALFDHSDVLFKGVELKKYIPPAEVEGTSSSLELPDSPSAIAEELSKQENMLNTLHGELNAGLRDKKKEEELWEIQRVVTQLKRKLRFITHIKNSSTRSEDVQEKNEGSDKIDEFSLSTVVQEPLLHSSPISKPSSAETEKQISVKNDIAVVASTSGSPQNAEFFNSSAIHKEKCIKSTSETAVDTSFSVENSPTQSTSTTISVTEISPQESTKFSSKSSLPSEDSRTERNSYLSEGEVPTTEINRYLSEGEVSTTEINSYLSEGEVSTAELNRYLSEGKVSRTEINRYLSEVSDLSEKEYYKERIKENVDSSHEDPSTRKLNDLAAAVESMLINIDNETFLKEIGKYTADDDSSTSLTHHLTDSSTSMECDNVKHFAAKLYLNTLGEELIIVGNDLKRKKNSEVFEVEKLKQEIMETLHIIKYTKYAFYNEPLVFSSSSTENISSDSERSSESESNDGSNVLEELIAENKRMEKKNLEYLKMIEKERDKNVNVKVLMKMLQTVRHVQCLTLRALNPPDPFLG